MKLLGIFSAFFFIAFTSHTYGFLSEHDFNSIVTHYVKKCGVSNHIFFARVDDDFDYPENKTIILVTTGLDLIYAQLHAAESEYDKFIAKYPETILLVDVQQGDGVLDLNGILHLDGTHLPEKLKYLAISNCTSYVAGLGRDYLKNTNELTSVLSLLHFVEITKTKESKRKNLKRTW